MVWWAGENFSLEDTDEGFYRISGITGSGKTHLVKFFVQDVLEELESNPDAKLIVYEPKREFFAWLSSLGLSVPIHYFQPSDTRSVALDFTTDYSDDNDAWTLAHAFYPERPEGHESPFWGEAFRTIYAGVYSAIRAKLGRADLRLMCLVLEDEDLTREVLGFDPYLVQARVLAGVVKKSESRTLEDIRNTIQSRIGQMKQLAAQMDCAARERPLFSLRRFIDDPRSGVLVISRDASHGYVQDPMNAVLFLRFTQLLDSRQGDPTRRIFVVIDEFPTLAGENRCPGVKDMFLRLRSRGATPLITDHGLTTLTPIYGKDTTALLGQCTNVIYLTQPDPESAEYAAKDLGVERGYDEKTVPTYGGEYATWSKSYHQYDRPIVPPSTLRNLFLASKRRGVEGWARSALSDDKKPWHFTVPPEDIDEIPETDHRFKEYEKRGPEAQRPRPLTKEEERELRRDADQAERESWDKFRG